jgi:hypothetical protein
LLGREVRAEEATDAFVSLAQARNIAVAMRCGLSSRE